MSSILKRITIRINRMETENAEQKVIELDYPIPPLGRNISGRLFDAFMWFVIGLVLLIPALFILQSNSTYQKWQSDQKQYKLDSGLYVNDDEGSLILTSDFYSDNGDYTFDEKSEKLDTVLTVFFTEYLKDELQDKGLSEYNKIKVSYNTEKDVLFSEDGKRLIESDDYDSIYFSKYCSMLEDKCIGYLDLKGDYLNLKKKTSLSYLIGIPLMFVLSYIIVYFVIPMCLNRGKRTLGMLISKTALLGADAMSCSNKRFICYFLFKLFIIFIGSFVGVLIPLAVSITMMVATKSHQSLTEYVTNTYLVMIDDKTVYKDIGELHIANNNEDKAEELREKLESNVNKKKK